MNLSRSEIENKLHIIRAGLECAPSSSTNAAACSALTALQEVLLADQATSPEVATICDRCAFAGCPECRPNASQPIKQVKP